MHSPDKGYDIIDALKGSVKALISRLPGFGEVIAGWDAYKRSNFERNIQIIIRHLISKIEDIETFFKQEYFETEEGGQFTRKVIDATFDSQLEDKQELFINALINGSTNQTLPRLEKLKFIDMLRHLSLASLMVLAEIHKMFIGQVRGPGRNPDPVQGFAHVDPTTIAEKLADRYDPYLVTSAISEMESQGLFSRTGKWRKDYQGKYSPGGGFATEMCYTDFAARFVEFITLKSQHHIEP
ncbi:hypothetical protein [Desulfosarcina sp.]|uniref:hypothetical protein n=1 Tax=Desulfosarcina sp. TaxID=2027861 RepID=UPI003970997B